MLSTRLFAWNFHAKLLCNLLCWLILILHCNVFEKKISFWKYITVIYKISMQCLKHFSFYKEAVVGWTVLLLLPDAWSSYEAGFDLLFWAVIIELLHCTTLLFTKHTNKSQMNYQVCCGYRVNPCATVVVCGWGWTLETMFHDAHSYCATMFHCWEIQWYQGGIIFHHSWLKLLFVHF